VETIVIPSSPQQGIAVSRQPPTTVPIDPTLVQAYEALQQGDFARARSLYEQVWQADPRNLDALLGLAAIAARNGESTLALRYYQSALELDPRNAYAQAGLLSIVGGADPLATESQIKLLIAREPSALLYFALGTLYADQGQWPSAQQAYFQAYQLQPDNPDYAFNLAVGLEHMGQVKAALDYYRKALDLSFRRGRANFDQNLVIQRVGQLSSRVEQ
jgi:tetratricopeptide (TPR) repeat protein